MPESASEPFVFKVKDATSYDPVAAEFEQFVDRLSPVLAKRLVFLASIAPGERVLDIGTGTGIVALEVARVTEKVVGIDLSKKFLALAETRCQLAGLEERVEFKTMDAEALELEDISFDVVVSLFALFHFPNPKLALEEMFRVVRPGGRLAVAVGCAPPWLSRQGVAHALKLVPELLKRLGGRQLVAPAFLDQLVHKLIPAEAESEESALAQEGRNRNASLPQLVREAGFEDLREHWEGHQARFETAGEFWDIQRTFSSIARKRLNNATPKRVAEVRAKFDELCARVLSRGGQLTYPFGAFFVSARRPGV